MYSHRDEKVPITAIVESANDFLSRLSPEQKNQVVHPLNAPEWRAWWNPEFYIHRFGLRLEEIGEELSLSVLNIIRATLSPEGYEKALGSMKTNHFLGELVGATGILNRRSYNFLIFGEPSTTQGWGWSLYGHHLCLNVFLRGTQIVIAPTFTGAEPNIVDQGPDAGTRILHAEQDLGLRFMQTLTPEQQRQAVVYELMEDPKMPAGRHHPSDQRHLGGAFQDNRVIPYEGIVVGDLDAAHQNLLVDILNEFHLYLPSAARAVRMADIRRHLNQTYFSWIGGYGDSDPFYYRIQSPVVLAEFDHHSGVWLSNKQPAKFHIHTLLRMPNAGDYGFALRD